MNKMRNKKGILFTVTTIFLLLAVFLLTSAYLTRNKELQRMATLSLAGDRLSYIEDDIADNIYPELLSLNLESIARASDVTIIFNHSNLISSRDHRQLMLDYETFIEETYSTLNNIDIDLEGFNNSFSISPYDSTFIIDSDAIYVYTGNPTNISGITLTIDVSELNTSDGSPGSTGSVNVEVNINHAGGEFSESADLDPAVANGPFYVEFEDGTEVEVNFGSYNGQEGVLRIRASGVRANIPHLELRYDSLPEGVVIKGGNISLASVLENITKDSEIIIAEE
ncbi:MAG: hypothetical protein KKD17_02715 [Nanoarchaeota archaeon]|nr:hypothetical protein [Nanoarchaeota archaeon]